MSLKESHYLLNYQINSVVYVVVINPLWRLHRILFVAKAVIHTALLLTVR